MAKPGYHTCPVDGCERNVGSAYLMCRSDWWRVSAETRQLVYDTFAAKDTAAFYADPDKLHHVKALREEYDAACDQAIAEANASRQRAKTKAYLADLERRMTAAVLIPPPMLSPRPTPCIGCGRDWQGFDATLHAVCCGATKSDLLRLLR